MQTQIELVKEQLLKHGYITRNYCLNNYITRLASRVNELNAEGYNIKGKSIKTVFGKDYEYRMQSC